MSINTRPWTEVYFRGRKLGMTPMENIELPAGKHSLELRNPQLDLKRQVEVVIEPGSVTRLNLTF